MGLCYGKCTFVPVRLFDCEGGITALGAPAACGTGAGRATAFANDEQRRIAKAEKCMMNWVLRFESWKFLS